jgi:hypothetical protein
MAVETPENRDRTVRLALTALLAPAFYALEWGLVGLTAALVAVLKIAGWSDLAIWLILWGLNLLFSLLVVLCSDRSRIDFTLMATARRLTDRAAGRAWWLGRLLELIVLLRLLFWDGPCHLLIYFRPFLPTRPQRAALLILASGAQMLLWAKLYSLGYDSAGDLLRAFTGDH